MKLILKLLRHKKSAFTLIELMMTIVVIGIVAIPISVTLSKQIQSVFISQDISIADNLARFDLELMNNTAFASIASASIANYQGYTNYNLTRTVSTVNPIVDTNSTKKVTAQITKSGSAVVLSSMTTYISNNVRYPVNP